MPRTGHFRQEGRDGADVRDQEDGRASSSALRERVRGGGPRASTSSATRRTCRMLEAVCRQCDMPGGPPPPQRRVVRQHRRRRRAVGRLDALGRVDGRATTSRSSASAPGSPGRAILLRFEGQPHDVRASSSAALRSFDAARSCSPSRTAGWSRTRPTAFAARLPLPPMLMVDRIVEIRARAAQRGRIVAERDVRLDDWFFQCHFLGDPVQPGCLGVDAVWQLLGFFCAWARRPRRRPRARLRRGRVLRPDPPARPRRALRDRHRPLPGARRRPAPRSRSATRRSLSTATPIYTIKRAKVGIFRDIAYADYPLRLGALARRADGPMSETSDRDRAGAGSPS